MRIDDGRKSARNTDRNSGFMKRLLRDTGGNTLAIVGAALIPLTGLIGSGVDMSRAYMAKTRLQSACDAASLAGRRVMTNDTVDTTVRNEAIRFFNFNFPQGMYGTTQFTPTVTRSGQGTVRVTASTQIPTAIMRIFGFQNLPLDVSCDATLNFVNTDILLVLDVTGSMDQDINGNTTYNNGNKKITALRDAVMALYDELAPVQQQLTDNGLRLRYGVVPYSSAVNVGQLILEANPDYLVDTASYQTRVPRYAKAVHIGTPGEPEAAVEEQWGALLTQAECDLYGQNIDFDGRWSGFSPSPVQGGGPAPRASWVREYSNNESRWVDWGWDGSGPTNNVSGAKRKCRRRYVQTEITYHTEYEYSGSINYTEESVDVSDFKHFRPVAIATGTNGRIPNPGWHDMVELARMGTGMTTENATWNGCIEERDTVHTITANSSYAIPQHAYDLDINRIPDSDTTRWRPMWPRIEYRRSRGTDSSSSGTLMTSVDESNWACPTAARKLEVFTRNAMDNYVNSLRPIGGTYHDIGMLWGARLISPEGIFAHSPNEYGGMPVSRHIIFMTDGQLAPNDNTYTSYGIEWHDKRVTGHHNAPQQHDRHLQRFKMICNSAKSMNVSIWVVAFATSLSTEMRECASNANQASISANRDQLIARFREIGSNIGALRLVQ